MATRSNWVGPSSLTVTEDGKTYNVVIVGSPNVNAGFKLVNNPVYPGIADDYQKTFRVLKSLPCDIFLGAHGDYYGMEAKVARLAQDGPKVFIDPEGYRAYVDQRERAFLREWDRQKGDRRN
jgi:metallo-beta-lactamase class B